jgi:hypothetical protein
MAEHRLATWMSGQAQELAVAAEQLRNLVTRFKLDDRAAGPAAIVPLRTAA